jgi:hypothetical protein
VQKVVEKGGATAGYWVLKVGPLSVPVVELFRGKVADAKGTVVVVGDGGRTVAVPQIEALLKDGYRVVAADLYYFGEAHPHSHDWLWSLMLATVGDRALGVQAAQLAGVAGWAGKGKAVRVVAVGTRTGTTALVAAALYPTMVAALELHDPPGSFKEVIEANKAVQAAPEMFCFGLLEQFDAVDVAALVAPRPVVLRKPSDRAKADYARLAGWYTALGMDFDPFK